MRRDFQRRGLPFLFLFVFRIDPSLSLRLSLSSQYLSLSLSTYRRACISSALSTCGCTPPSTPNCVINRRLLNFGNLGFAVIVFDIRSVIFFLRVQNEHTE
jgi:hypothetical protein